MFLSLKLTVPVKYSKNDTNTAKVSAEIELTKTNSLFVHYFFSYLLNDRMTILASN